MYAAGWFFEQLLFSLKWFSLGSSTLWSGHTQKLSFHGPVFFINKFLSINPIFCKNICWCKVLIREVQLSSKLWTKQTFITLSLSFHLSELCSKIVGFSSQKNGIWFWGGLWITVKRYLSLLWFFKGAEQLSTTLGVWLKKISLWL